MTEDLSGQILRDLLKAAEDDRKEFLDTGKEISSYAYEKDYAADYKDFAPEGVEIAFKAKIAKMAQAIDIFGPYLYPSNPTRRVHSRPWADQYAQARNQAVEAFLNYTPNETDLYGESCSAIVDALAYGRGVMWTGYDARKQLVCSVADTVENLLVDPDGRSLKQCNWKGRIRIKPRWEVAQKMPKQAELINSLEPYANRKSDSTVKTTRATDHQTEMIKYTEVYARVGLHNYREGFDLVNKENGLADDSPRKYIVSNDKVLWSGSWEVPFFRDGDWPCTELDFRERPNRVWPSSPLQPGLCHQRALNWVYTTFMNRMRNTFRKVFAVLDGGNAGQNSLSQDEIQKAIYGGDLEVIKIPWNGQEDVDIRKVLQELTISSGSEEFEKFYGVISKEFEDATGLTSLLMSGDMGYQGRIKADVELKDNSSKTRLNFWKDRVEKWQGKLARKEALTALFLQPRETIGEIFGQEAQMVWGQVLPPEQAAMTPFGIDFDKALKEANYTIESGSMRAKTPEQEQDAADMAMSQVVPVLGQMGLVAPTLAIIKSWAEVNQMPAAIGAAVDQAGQQLQQQGAMQQQQAQQQQAAEQQAEQQKQQLADQKVAAEKQATDMQHAHEMDIIQQQIQAQAKVQKAVDQAQAQQLSELQKQVQRLTEMSMQKETETRQMAKATAPKAYRVVRDENGLAQGIVPDEAMAGDVA